MTIIGNATRGSLYAQLSRQVKDAGLLERRPGYYTAKISLTVSAFVGVWAAVVLLGASWWTLAVAAVMAMAYTQIAFIGHDAGHKQIFRGHRVNYLFGVALGNLAVGLSYGWWIDKHNRHHANPNHEGRIPTSRRVCWSSPHRRRPLEAVWAGHGGGCRRTCSFRCCCWKG
jgi:fatty acid desaturase